MQRTEKIIRNNRGQTTINYSLEIGVVDEIRKATNGNYVLGSCKFAEQIAKALGRRVIAGKSGRPKLKPAKVL